MGSSLSLLDPIGPLWKGYRQDGIFLPSIFWTPFMPLEGIQRGWCLLYPFWIPFWPPWKGYRRDGISLPSFGPHWKGYKEDGVFLIPPMEPLPFCLPGILTAIKSSHPNYFDNHPSDWLDYSLYRYMIIMIRLQGSVQVILWPCVGLYTDVGIIIQCVPEKRKPINQVIFSENYNDLSKKVYIVTKFSLSSFFWPQLQDVLVTHGRARTISNGDVKIDLRRIGS